VFAGAMSVWLLLFALPVDGAVVLFDLGSDNSFRGESVPSPDGNGNYWNSVNGGAFFSNVRNIYGNATSIDFGFTTAGATDYYNGPSGNTQDPSATVYNAGALGNLGVDEAVYDYYSSSTFQIQQLNDDFTYDITFFSSRKYPTDDTETTFTAYTDGTFSTPITSVTLFHGSGSSHNQDQVAVLEGLSPIGPNDIIYIGYEGNNGGVGYLNAFEIKANVPEPSTLAMLVFGALAAFRFARRPEDAIA
jgi:hypothetical protein